MYNIKVIYTIYLIKSGGGTGPVKPGNLTVFTGKVLNPAVYPKDEDFYANHDVF